MPETFRDTVIDVDGKNAAEVETQVEAASARKAADDEATQLEAATQSQEARAEVHAKAKWAAELQARTDDWAQQRKQEEEATRAVLQRVAASSPVEACTLPMATGTLPSEA